MPIFPNELLEVIRIIGSLQGPGERIDNLQDRITVVEGRLARRRTQLIAKFTAMETLLGQLQAQSAAVGSQITSMFSSMGSSNK